MLYLELGVRQYVRCETGFSSRIVYSKVIIQWQADNASSVLSDIDGTTALSTVTYALITALIFVPAVEFIFPAIAIEDPFLILL